MGQGWSQSGQAVTLRSPAGTAPVLTGQKVYTGFNASYSGVNNPPVDWSVNGVPCSIDGQQSPTPTTPATTSTTPSVRSIIVEPATAQVAEGESVSFKIRLSEPPTEPQVFPILSMKSSSGSTWAIPPLQPYFTPTTWNTPVSMGVYNQPDTNTVNDWITFTVSLAGWAAGSITITQIDKG